MQIKTSTPLHNPPADYCPPGSEHWFQIPAGLDAGKTLFYSDHQCGNDEPETTVVFVHGNPESSYTYRHIRDALLNSGKSLRLVAMDHIGFGLSDQADFEMVDMHHAANLKQLITHLDLQDVTLVVHDWGGPIGIGSFIDEPERVKALLVMNTTVFPMPSDGLTYQNFPYWWLPWCQTPRLIPNALWGGVASAVVTNAVPQSGLRFVAMTASYLGKHAFKRIPADSPDYVWSQMLRTKANAKSSKRNVLQTPYWGHGYRYDDPRHGSQDNHAYYANIQSKINKVWAGIPVSGFFGGWDACGKRSVIEQWQDALPQIVDNTEFFPDLGHFIEEYKGPEMAQSILEMNHLQ
jgi:pimeloyl-ACP methyl ester carboxylesterase